MNTEPMPFLFEGEHLVRVVKTGESEPWFVAADICRVLGIKNARDAASALDEDEKGVAITDTLGGRQEMLIISESGMYALVFRSRKESAVRFRKWVTGEVLPSIRKTGVYTNRPKPPEAHKVEQDILPPAEKPAFPDWPLEEMRTKKSVGDLYRQVYGLASAQWIMPQLGFPTPPKELITNALQMDLLGWKPGEDDSKAA